MSPTVDAYIQALLALTGNPSLQQARSALLQSINDRDLAKLVKEYISRGIPRNELEKIASNITDVMGSGAISGKPHATRDGSVHGNKRVIDKTDTAQIQNDEVAAATPAVLEPVEPTICDASNKRRKRNEVLSSSSMTVARPAEPQQPVSARAGKLNLQLRDKAAIEILPKRDKTKPIKSRQSSKPSGLDIGLPMLLDDFALWCPSNLTGNMWSTFKEAPEMLQDAISRKIKEDFVSDKNQMVKFAQFLCERNIFSYRSGCCASIKVSSTPIPSHIYQRNMPRGATNSSCGYCTMNFKLCLRPGFVKGKEQLVLFPLPLAYRHGRVWRDIQFWVLDPSNGPYTFWELDDQTQRD